jgi:hypothetical protein
MQQILFVGGTCAFIHIESFNENIKAMGFLESKWDLVRKKLVRRLIEEQDKVLRYYFAQKRGTRSKGGDMENLKAGNMSASTYMRNEDTMNVCQCQPR